MCRRITSLYGEGKGFVVQVSYSDFKNNLNDFKQIYNSYDSVNKTVGIKVPKADIFKIILPDNPGFRELEDYMLTEYYDSLKK